MADNGTSVGVINLGLTVVDTLQQQLASIASKAKKQAGSSFSGVGDAAAKAITAPLDAAVKEAQGAAADAAKIHHGYAKECRRHDDAPLHDFHWLRACQQRPEKYPVQ